MNNAPDVTKLAIGKWPSILTHFGLDQDSLSGKHGPCPICGGKDRFRFDDKDSKGGWICNQCGAGDGMDMLMALLKCNFKQAAKELRPIVGGFTYSQPPNTKTKEDRKAIMRKNTELWRDATPISALKFDSPLHKYMAFRGLLPEEFTTADLRLVEELTYYDEDGKPKGKMPALLARVSTRDAKLALIHRTYLGMKKDGTFVTKKKMTSSSRDWKGGCAKLFSGKEGKLIIGEGIESTLSTRAIIYRKHGVLIPCWAALNADALANLAVPDHITNVMVATDNDNNFTGQKAAYTLANRLAVHNKLRVTVVTPMEAGNDFNDELRETYGCISDK